jgi:uncharacterized phage protein gp47/JayE
VSYRRHTYPEVLDSLLTDITGGVAAEPQPFPPPGAGDPPIRHTLLRGPVTDVISVYGGRDGQPHLFNKNKDYKLINGRTLEWQKGAELPDPGTLIYINYYPQAAGPVLTDIETGSVVRTLSEAVALELASLSAQLDFVYQSGFVDTATGAALDNVVALLGIERVSGGRAAGEVEFTRSSGSTGVINIPAGTRVATSDGKINYETTDDGSLAVGQNAARIPVRDLDPKNDLQPAGALTLLPVPISGIGGVSNPAPTSRLMRDETDEELRARAKNFLHGSERATLGAIEGALAAQGIEADVDEAATPGFVDITPHVDVLSPEARQRLLSAIDAVRPAGVVVRLKDAVPPVRVNLSVRLTTTAGMVEKDLRAIQRSVSEKIAAYIAGLPAKDGGSVNRLIGIVQSVNGVQDVKLLSLTKGDGTPLDTSDGTLGLTGVASVLGDLQITDPGLPTSVNVIVTYPEAEAPPDEAAIQPAWNDITSYINTVNATELPPDKRSLTFGKLLLATPLPGKPATTLAAFDAASGSPPALPTDADIAPYRVQFVFTSASGFSRILSKSADAPYVLAPLERLSVSGIQVATEEEGA